MRALLNANVLVALLDGGHVFHGIASEWLMTNITDGWASCPLTENGCVWLLTNPRYSSALAPSEVLDRLEEVKGSVYHESWPDDLSITDARVFNRNRLRGHQQVTDVYLLALAVVHGGRLVTFDQRISCEPVVGSQPERLVVL